MGRCGERERWIGHFAFAPPSSLASRLRKRKKNKEAKKRVRAATSSSAAFSAKEAPFSCDDAIIECAPPQTQKHRSAARTKVRRSALSHFCQFNSHNSPHHRRARHIEDPVDARKLLVLVADDVEAVREPRESSFDLGQRHALSPSRVRGRFEKRFADMLL